MGFPAGSVVVVAFEVAVVDLHDHEASAAALKLVFFLGATGHGHWQAADVGKGRGVNRRDRIVLYDILRPAEDAAALGGAVVDIRQEVLLDQALGAFVRSLV